MQFRMMSNEKLSFIYNLNLKMREHALQYAGTDKNEKKKTL